MPQYWIHIALLAVLVASPLSAHEGHSHTTTPRLPRVLLIGDSISIGYTPGVKDLLQGTADVQRVNQNCGPTTRGLANLDKWLGDEAWDVIHFNFGLHDLKYIDENGKRVPPSDGKIQVAPEDYRRNLTSIVESLLRSGATLIWCTTTPVPAGAHGRIPGDAVRYNRIALDVIHNVAPAGTILVNDLHGYVQQHSEQIQKPADVHFTPAGRQRLATQVSAAIRQALHERTRPATGIVFHDANGNRMYDPAERPLAGIRVSNGREIVTTGRDGRYKIDVTNDTAIFVLKPRGWRTPLSKENLPRFYYIHKPAGSPRLRYPGVEPTGPLPASIDFPLYPQREPDEFKALLFGDPQPKDQREIDFISHNILEALIGTDASFGVTLGDIVHDDLSLFEPQARAIAVLGIPWYNVLGNHDLNFDAQNDRDSDETFERTFGPAYYSFDYGPVHFLVLDDVRWFIKEDGKGTYQGGLGAAQMEFIQRDLAGIPADQLVVLMMHIPLVDVADRHQLYRLIEQRPCCLSVAAHTHVHEHRFINRDDGWQGPEPHHHMINVTVSGSWWQGMADPLGIPHATMADGAPNGYSVLSFDGNKYSIDFRAAGRPADYQMNIYAPEAVHSHELAQVEILANVFNGSERTLVEMALDDGRDWNRMQHAAIVDPAFRKLYETEKAIRQHLESQGGPVESLGKPLTGPKKSTHIWQGKLPTGLEPGVHVIHVRATDADGRVVRGRRLIRVVAEKAAQTAAASR